MFIVNPRNWLITASAVFFFLQLLILRKSPVPYWDEAVYVLMARHIATLGESGMWEVLRPPLLPILLSPIELFTNAIFVAGFVAATISLLGGWILYLLLKDHVDQRVASLAAIALLFSQLYFLFAHRALTGILAATIIIAAAYAHTKDKHLLTGALLALAFLARFPAGIALAVFGSLYAYRAIKQKRLWTQESKALLSVASTSAFIIGSWLFVNWLSWKHETAVWWHAAFRPLLYGSTNVFTQNLSLYEHSWFFYVGELFWTLPIILFALIGVFALKKTPKLIAPALTGVAMLIFFSAIINQQPRFILLALPCLFVLIALGVQQASKWKKIPHAKKVAITLLTLFVVYAAVTAAVSAHSFPEQPEELRTAYTFLQHNPVEGPVIVNDPLFGVYTHNKIIPVYYETLPRFRESLREEHDAVVFIPDMFPCYDTHERCQEELTHVIDILTTQQKLVYEKEFWGRDYYIFSNQDWFVGTDVSELRTQFGLGSGVSLSQHPYDRFPVVLILEDYPSLDDTQTQIWHRERYDAVAEVMQGVPATAAIIPEHIVLLYELYPELVHDIEFELAQNGDDHTELPGTDQYERISTGMEQMVDVFGTRPYVFIPPYYLADQETARVLEELEFTTYISTRGDPTTVPMVRLDQTNTLITNWERNIHKSPQEVLNDVRSLSGYERYALMNIFYFMHEDVESLQEIVIGLQEEFLVLTAGQVSDWLTNRSQTEFTVQQQELTLRAPQGTQGLTLLARQSGNFTLESNVPVHLKNAHTQEINVCINDVCEQLSPGHFFLSRSPMVIPPPPERTG